MKILSKWFYWFVNELEKIFLTKKFIVFQRSLCEKTTGKWSNEHTLNREIIWEISENNGSMLRIIRMRDKVSKISLVTELFEGCFIVDQCRHDLSITRNISLFYENQISIIDSLLIHGVTLRPEEKILLGCRDKTSCYWDLCFYILFSEYRHTASNRTNEWNKANIQTIRLKTRRYPYLILAIPIEISLVHDLIEENRYRARWGISENGLKSSYRDLLASSNIFSNLLEYELFLVCEIFHNSNEIRR